MQVMVQKEVEFYDDRLTAARADDGRIYVSVAEVCGVLGLDRPSQQRRIREHDVLGEGLVQLALDTAGGRQAVYMLRHDLVPLWLAGVQGRAVRDDVRPKLKTFQLRAAQVLAEAFTDGRLTAEGEASDALSGVSVETAQAVEIARAVFALARAQAALEARLGGRLEAVEGRLETIEAAMGNKARLITEEQATALSQAVKAVAMALGKASGRNEFGQVWSNLYRRYGVAAYRQLPARRFDEAMKWLDQWYAEATAAEPGNPLPF
jgi:hypothetical protein